MQILMVIGRAVSLVCSLYCSGREEFPLELQLQLKYITKYIIFTFLKVTKTLLVKCQLDASK